ncbi:MAG: hypothetical protein H6817_08665 [Phycisphaerales bacterium]|nr:hypothetical protein [Phycisphaerales bacterium]
MYTLGSGWYRFVFAAVALLMGGAAQAATRFVDASATGANNGSSWDDAYIELRDALSAASINPAITEIWVASGTYKPTSGANPLTTFQLLSGVAIRGGFAGVEGSVAERDLSTGATILSGDIGVIGNANDNCFHVVTGSGADATAVLENCTIADGNASLSALTRKGGGILIEGAGSAPSIINCTLRDNQAHDGGGGLYNYDGAPTLANCVFRENMTDGDGGGVHSTRGHARYVNCTFLNNEAGGIGGGVFTQDNGGATCPANANFHNCTFWGNTNGGELTQDDQIAAPENFCPPEFARSAGNPLILQNSCIQAWDGILGGSSNTDADPVFTDADGRIGTGSGCIDFGDATALPLDVADIDGNGNTTEPLPIDRDGSVRVVNGAIDAGAFEFRFDCNGNGVFDELDIAMGTSGDCDSNGVPDECDPLFDCNTNGSADYIDIATGASTDCNHDCVPDECTLSGSDCNHNGTLDECDLASGSENDCNANSIPDVCETDCNANGSPDDCDIAAGSSADCNTNALPDECEAPAGDCNGNLVPDTCELSAGSATDCNGNARLDECDIAGGTSSDCDGSAIPDECQLMQRFFVLDNGDVGNASRVKWFDASDPGAGSYVAATLPASGNDRGMTVYNGAGQVLTCDEENQRLLELDVFRGGIVQTIPVDRPLLELAYDWSTGRLFATAENGGLYRVDLTTGATTFITAVPGESQDDWVMLAYDDVSGMLIGGSQSENVLFRIDPNNGASVAFPRAIGVELGDLAVDFVDGTIYGIGLAGELYRVDRGSGEATLIATVPGIDGTAAGFAILLASDCTHNGILDTCEIAAGSSSDCNHNALPDACDADCNANGTPDACEAIAPLDWNADGITSLADFAGFPVCLGGPDRSPQPADSACITNCLLTYDFDGDGDVDLQDFAAVQTLLAGP